MSERVEVSGFLDRIVPTGEQLADIEAIRQLKARYFRTLDSKDWHGCASVFTHDVVIDTRDDTGATDVSVGRDPFVKRLQKILNNALTVHHGHCSEIEIVGTDEARAIWSMEDRIWFPPESGLGELHGSGWYLERYRRINGNWLISHMTLRRLRVELNGSVVFPH